MIKKITLIVCVLLVTACQQQDDSLIVVSLGGVHSDAQRVAFYKPFAEANKVAVVAGTYAGEMAKIRSMIETRQVDWDVVQVETPNLIRGCSEGLFEPLNASAIANPADFVNGNFSECGVGFFSWSIIIAYNTDRLAKTPKTWQDFWNIKDFPGSRGFQKTPMIALEAALLADNVAPQDIYKELATAEGVNRAFRKLDEIKPYIKWWEKGSQPLPMLLAGDVVMTTTFNGRGVIAQQEGKPVGLIWHNSFYDVDNFAIVKGSQHKELAKKFITFAISAKPQKEFSEYSSYGFVNNHTTAIINQQLLKELPNNPDTMQNSYKINANFWVEQGEALEQRFNVWAAQ